MIPTSPKRPGLRPGLRSGLSIAAADAPSLAQLLNVVSGAVIVGALYLGREFLIPITLAVLLAFVLAPLVRVLRRTRLPQAPSVLATVALSLLAVVGGGALIGSQIASLAQDLPTYQGVVHAKIEQVSGVTTARLAEVTGRLGLQVAQTGRQAARAAGLAKPTARPVGPNRTMVEVYRPPPSALDIGRAVLGPVLTPLATLGLVFVLAVFMLLQQADLRDRLIRLMGASDLHRTTVAMNDAATRLSRYFLTQLAVNLAFGALIAGGLGIIGVPHAILWGAVAGLLRFVPYLGGLLSTGLAVAMAAAADPGWSMAVWTVLLFLGIEAATGQVVEPLLYGHSTGLSPVSVVVAAVFWTWLWGPVGLILSTPLSLCLLVLGRHVPRLAFIDVLLGDRPPLTPVESFYQRMLADDVREIIDQARGAVEAAPLAAYYDDVALKGLLLAAQDAQRGILKRDRLVAIGGLVDTLVSAMTAPAAAEETGPQVLCVPGPGLLDDAAIRLLSDLLARQGAVVRPADYRQISAQRLGELDLTQVDAICVAHLSTDVSAARLVSLLDRLAAAAPGAPVVLVLAYADDAPQIDTASRPTLVLTSSLREAVAATALLRHG